MSVRTTSAPTCVDRNAARSRSHTRRQPDTRQSRPNTATPSQPGRYSPIPPSTLAPEAVEDYGNVPTSTAAMRKVHFPYQTYTHTHPESPPAVTVDDRFAHIWRELNILRTDLSKATETITSQAKDLDAARDRVESTEARLSDHDKWTWEQVQATKKDLDRLQGEVFILKGDSEENWDFARKLRADLRRIKTDRSTDRIHVNREMGRLRRRIQEVDEDLQEMMDGNDNGSNITIQFGKRGRESPEPSTLRPTIIVRPDEADQGTSGSRESAVSSIHRLLAGLSEDEKQGVLDEIVHSVGSQKQKRSSVHTPSRGSRASTERGGTKPPSKRQKSTLPGTPEEWVKSYPNEDAITESQSYPHPHEVRREVMQDYPNSMQSSRPAQHEPWASQSSHPHTRDWHPQTHHVDTSTHFSGSGYPPSRPYWDTMSGRPPVATVY